MAMAVKSKVRLEAMFHETVVPKLCEAFNLTNLHTVPFVSKIIVNVGIGRFLENQKLKAEIKDTVIDTLTTITGQRPIMIMAKQSVANFKVREGAPSAFMVTLRNDHMWHFLDRLMNLAMPRIKDFRGVKETSFDGAGNYSLGLNEQAVWPEINMAHVNFSHGMNINICFDRSNADMSRFALKELGMPFARKDDGRRR
jgi:large subunit ribosomal protein L5